MLSQVAPSLHLDGDIGYDTETPTYPLSVLPDAKLTRENVFDLYRDHYEGTKYDLTVGSAAGPGNMGVRAAGGVAESARKYGAWERSINMYRTAYTHCAEVRKVPTVDRPSQTLWWAPGRPAAAVFVPVMIHGAHEAPKELREGSMWKVI